MIATSPPSGYRFLIQLFDCNTEQEAEMTIWSVFGIHRVDHCALVPGTKKAVHKPSGTVERWVSQDTGYVAYVPYGWRMPRWKSSDW